MAPAWVSPPLSSVQSRAETTGVGRGRCCWGVCCLSLHSPSSALRDTSPEASVLFWAFLALGPVLGPHVLRRRGVDELEAHAVASG